MVAGKDYDCLPGLGIYPMLNTGGDVFFFPKSKDPAVTEAQLKMASMMISKPVQVAFNLKKGSLPIRADVDLAAANDCMKKGLKILDDPKNILPSQRPDDAARRHQPDPRPVQRVLHDAEHDRRRRCRPQFVEIIKNAPQ